MEIFWVKVGFPLAFKEGLYVMTQESVSSENKTIMNEDLSNNEPQSIQKW